MSQNASLLKDIDDGKVAPVYLVTGEEFLVRRTSEELVAKLLPKAMAGLNLSILEGVSPAVVARDLATAPMFRGRKVVVVREPEFLAPKKGRADALAKIKEAWVAGRRRVAANRALALLAKAGLGVKDLCEPDPSVYADELDIELADADLNFLQELGSFCKDEGIAAPEGDTGALESLLQKGLPKDHVLILEATQVDSRIGMVKLIGKMGVLVVREVERELRKLDIKAVAAEVLAPFKKRLDARAETLLKDLCGGNMRLLQGELEKVALYVGNERPTITEADVQLLVRQAREEEFRELADAIQGRNLKAALEYVNTALDQGEMPLRLHGSIATLVRGLVEARDRWTRAGFGPRTSQREFEAKGLPLLAEEMKAKKGGRMPHPYVAWLGFQACMRFEMRELVEALLAVARADVALKTGGSPRLVLESMLFTVCGKASRA